jgi:hypothetical protein
LCDDKDEIKIVGKKRFEIKSFSINLDSTSSLKKQNALFTSYQFNVSV